MDEEFDHGPIIRQVRVPVHPGDTADVLAARVLEQELKIYPQAVKSVVQKLQKESE